MSNKANEAIAISPLLQSTQESRFDTVNPIESPTQEMHSIQILFGPKINYLLVKLSEERCEKFDAMYESLEKDFNNSKIARLVEHARDEICGLMRMTDINAKFSQREDCDIKTCEVEILFTPKTNKDVFFDAFSINAVGEGVTTAEALQIARFGLVRELRKVYQEISYFEYVLNFDKSFLVKAVAEKLRK